MNTTRTSSKKKVVKSSGPSVTLNVERGVSKKNSRPNTIVVNTPGVVTKQYRLSLIHI